MPSKQTSLGDRFAEIAVILVTVIALAAGGFFKSSIENASLPFNVEGVSAQAPKDWLQSSPSGDTLLKTVDIRSGGFGATYLIRRVAVGPDVQASEVAGILSLEYAQKLLAFRVLDQREVTVYGRDAYEISYVFVESNPDVTHDQFPRVVRGMDYIYMNGDHAIVVSFQTEENKYDLDLPRFLLFLRSIKF